MIDAAEVGHDDRNRQGNYQHAAQRADRTEDLSRDRLGNHVSVPEVTGRRRDEVLAEREI